VARHVPPGGVSRERGMRCSRRNQKGWAHLLTA
jgi:hypothetical protein